MLALAKDVYSRLPVLNGFFLECRLRDSLIYLIVRFFFRRKSSASRRTSKRKSSLHQSDIEYIDKESEEGMDVDNTETEEDLAPPPKRPSRRRLSSSTASLHRKKRASLVSSTSGVSTAVDQTEDDDGDDKSYKTITPPAKDRYLGFSYTGGVSGGRKHWVSR